MCACNGVEPLYLDPNIFVGCCGFWKKLVEGKRLVSEVGVWFVAVVKLS